MCSVETVAHAQDEIAALPAAALASFAELMAMLEVAPWSGDAYNRRRPAANMRAHPFGVHDEGLAIYLIREADRRVVVVRVLWIG